MSNEELQKMFLETRDGIFTPTYTFDDYDSETDTYVNLVIHKTAQEVYDEWLYLKDNPPAPEPSKEEILTNEILTLTEQNIDLDFRVLMLEFALS